MTEQHEIDHAGREFTQMTRQMTRTTRIIIEALARSAAQRRRLAEQREREHARVIEQHARDVERAQRMTERQQRMTEREQRMAERARRMEDADLAARWAYADQHRDVDPRSAEILDEELRDRGVDDADELRRGQSPGADRADDAAKQQEHDTAAETDTDAGHETAAGPDSARTPEREGESLTESLTQTTMSTPEELPVEPGPEADAGASVGQLLDDADPWRSDMTDMTQWATDFSEPPPVPAALAEVGESVTERSL